MAVPVSLSDGKEYIRRKVTYPRPLSLTMDTPPTYQEATRTRHNWLKRVFVRLFLQSTPPIQAVESKLVNHLDASPSPNDYQEKVKPRRISSFFSSSSLNGTQPSGSGFTPPILPPSHRSSLHQSTALSPPTNYVRIKRFSPTTEGTSDIIGTWTIDTSLHVPGELLVPFKDKNEKRHHLHLWSQSGKIDADICVLEGNGKGEMVLLTASTEGVVSLRVVSILFPISFSTNLDDDPD